MNLDLKQKTAIVCGSSQGIGFAAAVELAELGANVVMLARNSARLAESVAKLPNLGSQNHSYLVADFAQPEQLKETITGWTGQGNVAEILINNTGGPPGGLAIDAQTDEFISAFTNHLICNQILVQALVPGMKEKSYGRIVNVISTSVKQPLSNLGVSNTIRGAVGNWAKTLANELGQFGITVNNVLPGATNTARLESILKTKSEKTGRTYEDVADEMKASIPAGRFADAAEVGSAIAFLTSPAASYINGINVPVDGGRTKCL
ncbi:SDR family oxidoreductase [Mariniblastus fucicola]|uniref:3-oxoacyl-[acyl-carrier-protein] reductase FabG n=1 Tax=Mariniblastus fucicola TaxID=980251 RepID=A0A5B9PMC2_9BACT|nr:SDR family oxidoreductase [Mariniblastus fucicola]QEG23741.1 3-oxoacyl-[acyl-carrier-protein] reductase FabG [Mariniblastus fucicola]